MFDFIIGLIELFCSSKWGLVGLLLGFAAAFVVWHIAASSPHQVQFAAIAYVAVFIFCLVVGRKDNGT
jgi:hypothetical protein